MDSEIIIKRTQYDAFNIRVRIISIVKGQTDLSSLGQNRLS